MYKPPSKPGPKSIRTRSNLSEPRRNIHQNPYKSSSEPGRNLNQNQVPTPPEPGKNLHKRLDQIYTRTMYKHPSETSPNYQNQVQIFTRSRRNPLSESGTSSHQNQFQSLSEPE
ncbi:hypothetical protein ATANTOWER_025053 [Ataeniobius toweri]|uniref:Uncharacterized protein n=1 Tax=Ataeniobius toweri TaxID=208326 RepID=A0ABU7AJ06_9TELE|nr:hypothetical protein [Ataeniobius toweri]